MYFMFYVTIFLVYYLKGFLFYLPFVVAGVVARKKMPVLILPAFLLTLTFQFFWLLWVLEIFNLRVPGFGAYHGLLSEWVLFHLAVNVPIALTFLLLIALVPTEQSSKKSA